jgi:hypothetical protein
LFLINSLKKGLNRPAGADALHQFRYVRRPARIATRSVAAGRALKNNQLTGGERHAISGTGH